MPDTTTYASLIGPSGSPAHTNSTFVYRTNLLSGDDTATLAPNPGADTNYVLVDENGRDAPAPWPAYTKAGCDLPEQPRRRDHADQAAANGNSAHR